MAAAGGGGGQCLLAEPRQQPEPSPQLSLWNLALRFEEPDLEEAFQSHRSTWVTRSGELTSACAAAVSLWLLAASAAGRGPPAAFQRANAVFGLALFSSIHMAFVKVPQKATRLYSGALSCGLLHLVAVCSLTHDRLANLLQISQPSLHPGFWTEASTSIGVTGLLMSVVLSAGLSLRWSLVLVHLSVALHASVNLWYGSLEYRQLAATCSMPPYVVVCCSKAASLYIFVMLAFAARLCREKEERAFFYTAVRSGAIFGVTAGGKNVDMPCANKAPKPEGSKPGREGAAVAPELVEPKDTLAAAPAEAELGRLRSKAEAPVELIVPAPVGEAKRVFTVPHPPPLEARPSAGAGAASAGSSAPNPLLVAAMKDASADWERIRLMAVMIRKPGYSLRDFFEDCVSSFPELRLYFHEESQTASSGVSNEAEYQRTVGALFAVYWLLRLHVDGRVGFCYGVDGTWSVCRPKRVGQNSLGFKRVRSGGPRDLPSAHEVASDTSGATKSTVHLEPGMAFFQMSEAQKRASFLETMQWSTFEDLIAQAGCQPSTPGCEERIMALLCLTAFHDVMKVEALLPVVQPEHAPYLGYDAGVVIRDHDIALSYVLVHFPELLPSFAGLPPGAKRAVLFTQGKMNFNHGWFVQAEAPPGAMLCTFKSVLMEGATANDLGLYFLHWLTDLAGAEATPLGGAEKFVLRFPHAVLASFLWSIPFLGKLESMNETAVVEQYLKARWRVLAPDTPCPQDSAAVACMRLAVMAQSDESVVDAFRTLPQREQRCLAAELARTGCADQHFSTSPTVGGGPAFLVYYGPALLQKNVDSPRLLRAALRAMAEVLRVARVLWPLADDEEGKVVTILIAELKTQTIDMVVGAAGTVRSGCWVLVRHNDREGAVELQKEAVAECAQGAGSTGSTPPLRVEALDFSRCFQQEEEDVDLTELGYSSAKPSDDDFVQVAKSRSSGQSGERAGMEWGKRYSSRRASQLPFAAEDEEFPLDATVESGLAASLRQENWLLRDQLGAITEELARLRQKMAMGIAESTAEHLVGPAQHPGARAD